jgi:hypothetical protein
LPQKPIINTTNVPEIIIKIIYMLVNVDIFTNMIEPPRPTFFVINFLIIIQIGSSQINPYTIRHSKIEIINNASLNEISKMLVQQLYI